jgi:hypothetical protein
MRKSTGLPREDAKSDFDRERRRKALASIVARLRSEPDSSGLGPSREPAGACGARS